jgi:sugar phosphate isomerase/epimerase
MIFAYSTNAFVKYSLSDAITMIARLGFGGVEIMCDRPHLYPPDFDERALDGLAALLKKHRLTITNLNSFTLFAVGDTYLPSWLEPQEARRQVRINHTLSCLRIASRLGCRNISVPPGGPLNGMSRKRALTLFYQGLERVIPEAEALQVNMLVEPEPGLLLENSLHFSEFINPLGSEAVGLNFDIGHFYCAGENPAHAFQDLFKWIGHVHLEDIAHDRTHNHLIPGRGNIDFREMFRCIRSMGYRCHISLELYPYVDMPEAAGRESLDYLAPLFTEAGISLEN